MLKGKKLSILGDSISTYKGVSNDEKANATLFYNPWFYCLPFPAEKTYWHRVLDEFSMTLCVNNSWSGGNLSGADNPDSGVNRARYLSRDDGDEPYVIIVFMGTNDLGRGVDISVFEKDYRTTLKIIKEDHPTAKVFCINVPDRDIFLHARAKAFCNSIEGAVCEMGENFFLVDLFNSRLNNDFYYMNTRDGLHPDEDGMKYIADIVIEAIYKNLN